MNELPDNIRTIKKYVDKIYKSDEEEKRRKKMEKHMDLYKGEMYSEAVLLDDHESKIQINYPFSNVETLCPLLTDNKPMWHIRARNPMFQNMANLFKLGLDFVWDYTDLGDRVIPEAVKWDLITDAGIIKTTYDPDEKELENMVIDPKTFVCAPGYDDNWKAPWQGEITRRPMSWVAENYPDYLDKVQSEASYSGNETGIDNSEKEFVQLEHERVTVYEIWMKDPEVEHYFETVEQGDGEPKKKKKSRKKYPNGRIVVFTGSCLLQDEGSPFEHGHPPYVFYYDYKIPGELWGMGEIEQIEHLHKEFNRQLQAVVKHSRLSHDKNYLVDEEAGMPENFKDTFWEGGQIYTVSMRNTDKPVVPVDPGPIDQAVITLLGMLPNAIEETSQVGDLMKGQSTKRERQSASEISVMIESSYTRVRQKVRNLEGSIKRTGTLNVELMQQFYKNPRTVSTRSSNEDGATLSYNKVGSNRDELLASNKPPGPPELPTGSNGGQQAFDQKAQAKEQAEKLFEETELFIANLGPTDSVYWKFVMEIQTNSTLPMDKQTLANLYLRLAQINITPDSIVDAKAVLAGLGVPDADSILARKQKEKQMMMKAQQRQAQPPNAARKTGPPKSPMGLEALNQGGATV